MTNKYSQKLFDSAKKSTRDAIITAPKTVIQKAAEATSYLIGNKKKTNVSKKLHSKKLHLKTDENKIEIPKERYISPE